MSEEKGDALKGTDAAKNQEVQRQLGEVAAIKAIVEEALNGEGGLRKQFEAELANLRGAAAVVLTGAEVARKAADDHAGYADRAKISTEAHAGTVAKLKGQIEADAAAITQFKQKADEQAAALGLAKASVAADIKVIGEQKSQIQASAEEIKRYSITGAGSLQEIGDAKIAALDGLKAIQQSQAKASDTEEAAIDSSKTVDVLKAEAAVSAAAVADNQKNSTTAVQAIAAQLTAARTNSDSVAKISAQLKETDGIAKGHEERIQKFSEEIETLKGEIEKMLPWATSATLASAFKAQQQRFKTSQHNWFWTFISCMIALFVISFPSFFRAAFPGLGTATFGLPPTTWGEVFIGFTMRLPILAPLIWLSVYAGRNYMLSIRLEEDYAYKEAVSTAFEGYKKQMSELTSQDGPLVLLCRNVLNAMAERPGRIYEGRPGENDISAVKVVAEKLVDVTQELRERQPDPAV